MQEHFKKDLKLLSSFVVIVTIIWSSMLGGSLIWNISHGRQDMLRLAKQEARAYFNKDQAFRLWASSHGGVYVEVNDTTPPNPNLSHIPERDIVTPSGRELTLMNPAYMLRQLMKQHAELYGVKSKITSLKLFNPINMPDEWERAALKAFESGQKEVTELTDIDGFPYLRFIKPMITQEGCLKCHQSQGYKVGDVRGGVGVAIPMGPYWALLDDHKKSVVAFHIMLWVMGMAVLFFLTNRGKHMIIARAALEEEREKLNRQMALILNSLEEGVFGIDQSGTCTFVNPATLKMSGFSKEQLLNKCIHTALHHTKTDGSPYPIQDCTHMKTISDGKTIQSSDEIFWKKDGASFPVEFTSSPLKRNGENEGAVVTFRDLTTQLEKEKMERHLGHVQKLESIGTLAGGIAHDFNNILSVIIGYSELALDSIPEENQARSQVKQVLLAGNRAKDLVQQILTFSRQSEQELQPLKLQPIIKESLKLLRASIPTTIKLQQDIKENCGEILGDPTHIHQIIMNLCTNAYHAMQNRGGTIEISLSKVEFSLEDLSNKIELDPGSYVRLTVSDTGAGIDQNTLTKIFDPYFTTKEKGEGTGLGLAIVHGLIKGLSGAITVYSEVGQGTTFQIYLPEIVPNDIPVEDLIIREIQRGDERILVVDDEDAIVKLIKKMLESLGYRVTAFTSSVDAFEAFQKQPSDFDLIITDMTMPKLTGMELSRKVLKIKADMPIIICTGFSELITDKKAKNLGIKKLLMKPVLKSDMAKVIREIFDNH